MGFRLFKPGKAHTNIVSLFLVASAAMTLASCNEKPDYEVKRLRVDAIANPSTSYNTDWKVEFLVANNGGFDGLGPDDNGVEISRIPVLFTASISNDNLNGCPSQSSDNLRIYDGPNGRQLMTWKEIPSKSGAIFQFPNVFMTSTGGPGTCVPYQIKVDLDAARPDYESTVDETNEVNNGLIVRIINWPEQKTWVCEPAAQEC